MRILYHCYKVQSCACFPVKFLRRVRNLALLNCKLASTFPKLNITRLFAGVGNDAFSPGCNFTSNFRRCSFALNDVTLALCCGWLCLPNGSLGNDCWNRLGAMSTDLSHLPFSIFLLNSFLLFRPSHQAADRHVFRFEPSMFHYSTFFFKWKTVKTEQVCNTCHDS